MVTETHPRNQLILKNWHPFLYVFQSGGKASQTGLLLPVTMCHLPNAKLETGNWKLGTDC
jgi:hypothetical protein